MADGEPIVGLGEKEVVPDRRRNARDESHEAIAADRECDNDDHEDERRGRSRELAARGHEHECDQQGTRNREREHDSRAVALLGTSPPGPSFTGLLLL